MGRHRERSRPRAFCVPTVRVPHWCSPQLGAVPAGDGALSSSWLPEGLSGLRDGGTPSHCTEPPPVECPLLAVGSDTDAIWPGELVCRWEDVAGAGYRGVTLEGLQHMKLMNDSGTRDAVYAEVACAALSRLGAGPWPPRG